MSRIPPASLRLTCGTLKTPFSGSSTYFFSSQLKQNLSLDAALKISAKSLPWTLKAGPKRVLKAQQNLLPIITQLRCRRNVNFQMSLSQVFFVNKLSTLFGQNETFSAPTGGEKNMPLESLNANMGELLWRFEPTQVEMSFKTAQEQKAQSLMLNPKAEQASHKPKFKGSKVFAASVKPALSRNEQNSFPFDSWAEENNVLFFLFCAHLIFAKKKAKNNLMVHRLTPKFKLLSLSPESKLKPNYQMTSHLAILRPRNELAFGKHRRLSFVYESLKPRQAHVENHGAFKFALNRSFHKSTFLNLFSSLPYALEPCLSQGLVKLEKRFKRGSSHQNWKIKKPCFVFFPFQKSLLNQKLNKPRFHTSFILDLCKYQNPPYDWVSSIRF